ncbi:hypothetical protein K438DRAFT_1967394 [Mycena galopus ATCC 62051]|nr:hypothetical protein K438DRAFT_1967394 [Mycena galopus ATCC 62051]
MDRRWANMEKTGDTVRGWPLLLQCVPTLMWRASLMLDALPPAEPVQVPPPNTCRDACSLRFLSDASLTLETSAPLRGALFRLLSGAPLIPETRVLLAAHAAPPPP